VGIIDLVATLDGKRTLVDFKTASSAYETHEALLSDQLTAYQLAEPDAEQVALCVLVKTKTPRIEWLITRRSSDQLVEYLTKARFVAHEIRQEIGRASCRERVEIMVRDVGGNKEKNSGRMRN